VTPQNWQTVVTKKGCQFFQEKIGVRWHPQLPPRVTPTLVTPLSTSALETHTMFTASHLKLLHLTII